MDRYIAYVGTYTHGSSKGIHIFDMDIKAGRMSERKVVPINNPSDVCLSTSGKYLYSIADNGVEAFEIKEDGDLSSINSATIEGMRGCHLSTDSNDKFLFVSGYHDGKVTVLELLENGGVGRIYDGIFHKGLGSVAERNFRPHISCSTLTPGENYLCVVDLGVDHVNIYRLNKNVGKLDLVDILRCEIESAPRHIMFSEDGKYAYLLCELKSYITVYRFDEMGRVPSFEKIQTVSTLDGKHISNCAAAAMRFTNDGKRIICSNAGDNSVCSFKIDKTTGKLTQEFVLPIGGEYPKDIDVFPDDKHIISLNHESDTITIFTVDYDKKTIIMNGPPISIETPNSIVIKKL